MFDVVLFSVERFLFQHVLFLTGGPLVSFGGPRLKRRALTPELSVPSPPHW